MLQPQPPSDQPAYTIIPPENPEDVCKRDRIKPEYLGRRFTQGTDQSGGRKAVSGSTATFHLGIDN